MPDIFTKMSETMDEKNEIAEEAMDTTSDPEMTIDEKNDINADVDMKDDSPQSPECDASVPVESPSGQVKMARSPSPPSSPSPQSSELTQQPQVETSKTVPGLSEEVAESAQSPVHANFDPHQSPIREALDSAESPVHEVADSALSPVHQGVTVTDSADSPVHEHFADSAQSPVHDDVPDSAQSPSHEGSQSASDAYDAFDPPGGIFIPSPVQVADSAQSPVHEQSTTRSSQSQEIFGSAQSPTHEADVNPTFLHDVSEEPIQRPSHDTPEVIQTTSSGATREAVALSQSKSPDEPDAPSRDIQETSQDMNDDSVEILQSSSQDAKEKGSEADEEMEDGEIEDDEDEDMPVIVKEEIKAPPTRASSSKLDTPSAVIATILPDLDTKSKHRSKRHDSREKSKEKEKESKPSKDKENKKEKKKRRHSKDEGHESGDKSRAKRNRKGGDDEEGALGDEDDYLFVRGASPSNSPDQAKTKFYEGETDAFGRRFDDADVEFDRRRRSRSPDRRRGGGVVGNRRPNSGRKEPPKNKSDQICAYYMQGKCQKSHEECAFSHNAVPPRKMELCKFWMMECCAKKEKCLYLHNDFPCKYYHTGLVCKQALRDQCKFSHKPLNEVTKAVLLKHIETAPKEILGDFPRLNRTGAINLINKMEARINRELELQERDDDHRRRTRWEQPTHEDDVKLQSLMEEAGIENYYDEAVGTGAPGRSHGGRSPPRKHGPPPGHQRRNQNFYGDQDMNDDHNHHHNPNQRHNQNQQHQNQNQNNNNSNPNFSMLGINPMLNMANMGLLPNQLQPMLPGQSPIVHNPALANVLANLQIPSTTIHPPPHELGLDSSLEEGHVSQYQQLGKLKEKQSKISQNNETNQFRRSPNHESTTPPPLVIAQDSVKEKQEENKPEPPEHLPPMQKELFRRIQEQQLKNEKKSKERESESDDEKPDDVGWYSSDEETEKPPAAVKPKDNTDPKPVVDFASVLSAIRQKTAAAAQSKELSDNANGGENKIESSPPRGRGDVDLRYPAQPIGVAGSSGQGPFGDTDFRLPSLRPEFKDIDLRLGRGGSPGIGATEAGRDSPVAPVFKSMPTGPATMIDASLNSHPPMVWKVQLAYGVGKPDYSYIRHTLTPQQMALDPRFGPRTAGGISILPDPSSPPPSTSATASPATIPGGDLDPRVRRGQATGQQSQQPPHGDPRFGRDPRSGVQQAQQTPQSMMPTGWPMSTDMTQAAIQQAAQLMAAQQLGLPLLPFPNATGLPFPTPEFAAAMNAAGNNNTSIPGRPPFHGQGQFQGTNQFMGRPPSSSWERMQSGGGVTPPI